MASIFEVITFFSLDTCFSSIFMRKFNVFDYFFNTVSNSLSINS